MKITEATARRIMAEGRGCVRRYDADTGVELAPATEWMPDASWSTVKDENGQTWAIIDLYGSPEIHHAML